MPKTKIQIIQEKRGEQTRKRRKKYLNEKHNKPKKKKQRTFPLKHPPKSIFNPVLPASKKLSWWKRLWNWITRR